MPTVGRPYLDGNGDSRTMELFVDPITNWERLGHYDAINHQKLDDLELLLTDIKNRLPSGTITTPTIMISAIATSTGDYVSGAADKTLFSISAMNTGTGLRYLQVFDRSTTPSAGAAPVISVPVYANSGFTVVDQQMLGPNGMTLSNGIAWGISTTPGTYTAATASECFVFGRAA
jgi:hypothetical protein